MNDGTYHRIFDQYGLGQAKLTADESHDQRCAILTPWRGGRPTHQPSIGWHGG